MTVESVCLFCCNICNYNSSPSDISISGDIENNDNLDLNITRRFLQFSQRFARGKTIESDTEKIFKLFGNRWHRPDSGTTATTSGNNNGNVDRYSHYVSNSGGGVGTCKQCLQLAEGFCNLYHEWKCLELKLQWKLEAFGRMMKEGGRVSSRQEALKKSCAMHDEITAYGRVLIFRHKLIRKCTKNGRQVLPRVMLPRYELNEVDATHSKLQSWIRANDGGDANADMTSPSLPKAPFVALIVMLLKHLLGKGNNGFAPSSSVLPLTSGPCSENGQETETGDMLTTNKERDKDKYNLNNSGEGDEFSSTLGAVKLEIERLALKSGSSTENEDDLDQNNVLDETDDNHDNYCDSWDDTEGMEITEVGASQEEIAAEAEIGIVQLVKIHNQELSNSEVQLPLALASSLTLPTKAKPTAKDEHGKIPRKKRKFDEVMNESPSPPKRSSLRARFKCDRCRKTFSNPEGLETHKKSHLEEDEDDSDQNEDNGEEVVQDQCDEGDDNDHPFEPVKLDLIKQENQERNNDTGANITRDPDGSGSEEEKTDSDFDTDSSSDTNSDAETQSPTNKNARRINLAIRILEGRQRRKCITCINCSKTFFTNQELEVHMKLHGDFSCSFCTEKFSYAVDMALHEVEVHPPPLPEPDSVSMSMEGQPKTKDFPKIYCPRECSFYLSKGNLSSKALLTKHLVEQHLDLSCCNVICEICQKSHFMLDGSRASRSI